MSIVSKTDRFGIDVVIEDLQQNFTPKLLAFWSAITTTDYEVYPRVNKNPRDSDTIPEISLLDGEYKGVLFDDNFALTSFYIASDQRVFNEDTKQLKTTLSIIFQANLKTLYAQTNRPDEEFNMNVLDVIKKDNFYINSDITIIEGVDNVYSDLTFSEELNNNIKKHDMSEYHVVKFVFDVIHKPDCFPSLPVVCPPGGTPVDVEFQGVPTATQVPAGGTVDFQVINASGGAPLGSLTTDTAIDKIVEVTLPPAFTPSLDFLPMKTGAGDLGSFASGDDGSTNSGSGVDAFILDSNNPFGNLFVFTGKGGGYWDHITLEWKDKNGVVTTEALAIPDDIVLCWASYTGGSRVLGMYRIPGPIQNQAAHNLGNVAGYTFVGFTDWETFTDNVGEFYIYRGLFRNPFNYPPISHDMALSSDQIWSSYKDNVGGGWKWAPTAFNVVATSVTARTFYYRQFILTTDLGL